jgi:hypothetical protein
MSLLNQAALLLTQNQADLYDALRMRSGVRPVTERPIHDRVSAIAHAVVKNYSRHRSFAISWALALNAVIRRQ